MDCIPFALLIFGIMHVSITAVVNGGKNGKSIKQEQLINFNVVHDRG